MPQITNILRVIKDPDVAQMQECQDSEKAPSNNRARRQQMGDAINISPDPKKAKSHIKINDQMNTLAYLEKSGKDLELRRDSGDTTRFKVGR